MRTRKIIYTILGLTLILLNLLMDLIAYIESQYTNEIAFNIGYFIGSHFLLFFGILMLRLAFKLKAKLTSAEEDIFEKKIEEIGSKAYSGY